MRRMRRTSKRAARPVAALLSLLLAAALALPLTGCDGAADAADAAMDQLRALVDRPENAAPVSMEDLPAYDGAPYVAVNGNQPDFTEADQTTTEAFEYYSELDSLGRCGVCMANVCQDLLPTEKRGSISSVRPSGWQIAKYDSVDGKYLYNRCHLLGYQLTGENAEPRNLITGTRYLNVEGMLPFEDMVHDYVVETGNHVLYRVTPVFVGDDLVARGVEMEGWSVEDQGEGICFHVFAYNVQPGVTINYADGSNAAAAAADTDLPTQGEIRGNARSKIYHCPGQRAYEDMADSRYLVRFATEEEAQAAGYRKAKQ